MAERLLADVCVIGGGPAGSTVAAQLAALGHAVALVEAHAFPRPHIGASLPPSIVPLLEEVGVFHSIEHAGFVRAERSLVKWPDLRNRPSPPGFHVDRSLFDQILLEHARARGVRVFEAAWASKPQKCPYAGEWLTPVQGKNARFEIASPLVIDASGRQTMGSRRLRFSVPTVAVYGYWRRSERNDLAGRIEAGEAEWIWYAPVTQSQAIAAVFLDPKRLSGLDLRGIAGLYRKLLTGSDLIGPCLESGGGEVVHVCDATSRACSPHATRDFIRVGDASLKLDPLSSQGVQLAIAEAIQAAIVCNTLLTHPSTADAAVSFYEARQSERLEQHRSKAARLYAEVALKTDNPFWTARACSQGPEEPPPTQRATLTASTRIKLAPDVTFETTPAIENNIVIARSAVRTSTMKRPVAYLEGIDLVCFLEATSLNRHTCTEVQDLCRSYPVDSSWRIIRWLWDNQIIVPHEQDQHI